MKKKGIKRINLWVDEDLFKQIKSKADEAYLKVATFTRQLLQQAMKNKSIYIKGHGISCSYKCKIYQSRFNNLWKYIQ